VVVSVAQYNFNGEESYTGLRMLT